MLLRALLVACALSSGAIAAAQDAARGAQRYLQLPQVPSCVSCHGPDPSQGRNNLLRGADNPLAIRKALNTVGVMGYLASQLGELDVADIAAYLGRVIVVADPGAPLILWPVTLDFGTLPVGAASPEHRVRLRNRSAASVALVPPQVVGTGFAIDGGCNGTLAGGSTCDVVLRWTAPAAGNGAGALLLGGDEPLVVGLAALARGQGVGALSALDPAALMQFGPTPVGESSHLDRVLMSSGSEPVTITSATLIGPQFAQFAIGGDCAAERVLPPGASCTLRVSYRPSAPGTEAQATLQVRGSGSNPGNVMLIGSAAGAPPAPDDEPAPPSGGGCAAGPPARLNDPALAMWLALSAMLLWLRQRRSRLRA